MPSLNASAANNSALAVRKAIYSHDVLSPADMQMVFDGIRQAGKSPSPEWTSLFSEALTDYVVHQNEPADYILDAKAEWLMQQLRERGGISTKAEFAMLIDVMNRALGVPPALSVFGLEEIATAITKGRRTAFTDEDHPAGIITAPDVEALRAVLYAATAGSTSHVTREEAEVLFDIAHATAKGKIDPSFDDFFARAIGNYLMAIALHVPSETEELHRDKWLDEHEGMPGFFSRLFSKSNIGVFDLVKSPLRLAEDDMAKLDAKDDADRAEAEKITDDETSWVLAHLTRDSDLTSAEKRLLEWLSNETHALPAPLNTILKAANTAATPKTFGQRQSKAS